MDLKFDHVAEYYSQSRKPLPDYVYEFVLGKLLQQRSYRDDHAVRYLDVATGTGTLVRNIPMTKDLKIVALDISSAMLERARSYPANNEITFIQGDVHHLPFEDSSLDLVSCCQALHLFEPDRFYDELNRVLAPYGLFIIITYDLIANAGSPARYTNDVFRSILAHDMWPGFSETGIHPILLNQLEQNDFVPFETVSRETMFTFDAEEWQQRIESSSFSLKIVSERVRRVLLDEHAQRLDDFFKGSALQQRQRCWIVVACKREFAGDMVQTPPQL